MSRRLEAADALARWPHPRRGIIPPSAFIPMAERAGLMGELGYWTLDQAIALHRRWRDQGLDLGIAVNLSPRLLHKSLHEAIVGRFSRVALPLCWLTLEYQLGTRVLAHRPPASLGGADPFEEIAYTCRVAQAAR
jgi:EAL domain-containing protein (putative c-di-GMP-specific phosphodiesterase class I)